MNRRRRPVQDVRFESIQHRKDRPKRPWIVRWVVDGQPHSRSRGTEAQAKRLLSRLMVAHDDGEPFDRRHGEPVSWLPQRDQISLYDWARQWLAEQWTELAPRTRDTYVTSLTRFVPLVVPDDAPTAPEGMFPWLDKALRPGAEVDATDLRERWLRRWSMTLGDLDRRLLAEVDRKLGIGANGKRLAASTAARRRKNAKACIRRAVELEAIPTDPWPPTSKGRSRRKANQVTKVVDIRRLPDPPGVAAVISALPNKVQPYGSRTWEVMSAVAYYSGLRPSEVVMLRRRALELPHMPAGGWGRVHVVEADDGYDRSADTKTGITRSVPVPPVLTDILHQYLQERPGTSGDLLFRTDKGTRPALRNWRRALLTACEKAKTGKLKPYDLRHACATTWLQAGVPLGEAARRLGHSVQTLVSHYVQALTGDEETANARIEAALDPNNLRRRTAQ